MDHISNDTLRELMTFSGDICFSIYLPMVKAGKQTEQNSIRFKNMLRKAETELTKLGYRQSEREEFMKPAGSYLNDRAVWTRQEEGLAVFIADGTFMPFRLPISFTEDLMSGSRFYVKPLLPLVVNDGTFYLLTLALEGVSLYRGTRFTMNEIEFDAPPSMEKALGIDALEPLRQSAARTTPFRGGGNKNAMFSGHGLAFEDVKTRILQYFLMVDDTVHTVVQGKQIPMVLAANDHLIPIYHEANTYPKLLDEAIRKNPHSMGSSELHREAWNIVKPEFERIQHVEYERFMTLSNTEMASDDVAEIVSAAPHDRIETLFIARGAQIWGTYDSENFTAKVNEGRKDGDQDLLDFAAMETYLHNGTVFVADPAEIPGRKPVSAIFRY